MQFEDISLLSALLVAFYVLPVLYLTVERVSEFMKDAASREPQGWWTEGGFARFLVGLALSLSLFLFYMVFAIPLLGYGFCGPLWYGNKLPPRECEDGAGCDGSGLAPLRITPMVEPGYVDANGTPMYTNHWAFVLGGFSLSDIQNLPPYYHFRTHTRLPARFLRMRG
ncbi:hypothetical protein NUW58_g2384 [Xylaria curta]|uniref:Uncharacterized protein n=2 Tax=Xylaria curta TaxID=42375 RepID=A0ACC1PH83_9PEZI|nr:hypothetical protein NUW58_g7450 [Xylaria curta]KAJ2991820.1 hypothetical protein NUW58_g2384 [Xylaria curta]